MRIMLNGNWHELEAATLSIARALEGLGYGATAVATALNGEFVAAGSREMTPLHEGDRLEVLAPMQGG